MSAWLSCWFPFFHVTLNLLGYEFMKQGSVIVVRGVTFEVSTDHGRISGGIFNVNRQFNGNDYRFCADLRVCHESLDLLITAVDLIHCSTLEFGECHILL